ncbi:MAG: amidase [SAR202 cluster bacterium]|nr:amidase [SAR202 cluster bacterium]
MPIDLKSLTIFDAASLLRSKKISSVELVEASLKRIEALNPKLNAYVTVAAEKALESAKQAQSEIDRGQYRGPLHGIPMSVKDIFYTQGIRTASGEKKLEKFVPTYDATMVAKLKAAGAIIVGKTTPVYGEFMPEPYFGYAKNPWDSTKLPGYSSSGSAVAVSTSMDLGSVGSDGGGSVRYPAACCGLVGMKPTFGRVSRYGSAVYGIPNDYVGPLTRTAFDNAIVLEAIAGYDPRDPFSADLPVPKFSRSLSGNIRGMRIGVPKEHFWDLLDSEVESASRKALTVFEEMGCEVEEVSIPAMPEVDTYHSMLSHAETSAYYQPQLKNWPKDYPETLMLRVEWGAKVPAIDYIKGAEARSRIRQQIDSALEKVDALFSAASVLPPPPLGHFKFTLKGVDLDIGALASRLQRPYNTTGHPAVVAPCGFTKGGLPLSFQLGGRNFDEAALLKLVDGYQRATDWHTKRPKI